MLKHLLIIPLFALAGCEHLAQKIVEETVLAKVKTPEVNWKDDPVSERFEVLTRKKSGEDSIYLVRNFLVTGQKYSDTWYKNNFRDGIATHYYADGKISHTFRWRNDSLLDEVTCIRHDGVAYNKKLLQNGSGNVVIYNPVTYNLYFDYKIKDSRLHGRFRKYFENGTLQQLANYYKDTVCGDYTIYFKSGKVSEERKADSIHRVYYLSVYFPSGEAKSHTTVPFENATQQYSDGSREYNDKGLLISEDTVINHKQVNIKYFYFASGILMSKGQYAEYKKDGPFEYYYESGGMKALEIYSEDILLTEIRWNENGKKSEEAVYKNNLRHGLCKQYYENGELKIEQEYIDGIKDGAYTSYYDNKNVYNKGQFKNNKPFGEMKYYNRDGSFMKTKTFPLSL